VQRDGRDGAIGDAIATPVGRGCERLEKGDAVCRTDAVEPGDRSSPRVELAVF
jgi:hypothetical protein